MKNHVGKSEQLSDNKMSEYVAIRSEILTWISVKYSLIAITASVTAISLSILSNSSHWSWFSAAIISIIACLGFLTSHANSKITIAATYITIFHPEKTNWDHLIYEKFKWKNTLASVGYVFPLVAFYIVLLFYVIFYPAILYNHLDTVSLLNAFKVLILPLIFYVCMIYSIWRSEKRETYEKIWSEFTNKKEN